MIRCNVLIRLTQHKTFININMSKTIILSKLAKAINEPHHELPFSKLLSERIMM